MKNLMLLLSLIFTIGLNSFAQFAHFGSVSKAELPTVFLSGDMSIHFVSPEPIQYVDISSKSILGDFPLKNLLRIKALRDTSGKNVAEQMGDAVVTITGEKFIAQYHVVYSSDPSPNTLTKIDILPEHMHSLDISNLGMSQNELKAYAMRVIAERTKEYRVQSKAYGIKARLNNVFTLDDYIFLDLSYENQTNLKYDIDQLRFTIEDRKVNKASTVQAVEVKPEFVLFKPNSFKKHFRNVYVFKKFTYPGNKLLKVEMNEKQLSGRVSTISLKYSEILGADIL
ncbi:conjugative transposon protein TraN [Pedobacter sp. MC2016-24]|uniref:conjugative transposon protein TraN n=1 Tax=Pedobacter sp. MC2016-24 TaxID=2780090 RepID=UPI00187FC68D|nr:conjugative transposon protein TraN [Pedobacter sp. MC2016-24]MBE9599904.1 conjugative transposon protein TraN [Pedobacter sp. MC2016-24]